MRSRLEQARRTRAVADRAAKESRVSRAAHYFSSANIEFLSHAVLELQSAQRGIEFLRTAEVVHATEACELWTGQLFDDVRAGNSPNSAIGGIAHFLIHSHICLLQDQSELSLQFARWAVDEELHEFGSPFWKAYAERYLRFLKGSPFELPMFNRLQREEKYWYPYLELMNQIAMKMPIEEKCNELLDLFEKRRNDKSYDDPYMIDGSALRRAHWDYHLEALLRSREI